MPICDYWMIIDNSEVPPTIIAEGSKEGDTEIYNKLIYDQIIKP